MRYRICDQVPNYGDKGESDLYRKFKYQFDNLLSADDIPTNEEDFERLYVSDSDFEEELTSFLSSVRNSTKFCVGYTGIGKSTSIRHCLGLGVSNVTRFQTSLNVTSSKRIIVFPTFLDSAKKVEEDLLDITSRIATVCTTLEENHPELYDVMGTANGRQQFYIFIRNHTPKILEIKNDFVLAGLSPEEKTIAKLKYAQENHSFEYTANKLKFYIKCKYNSYNRLVILLDDIETLPEKQQCEVIEKFLQFFSCMNNTDFPADSDYRINLLISIRPHTLRLYREYDTAYRKLEAFPLATNPVLKKDAVKLNIMFKKRFDFYTSQSLKTIGNRETWDNCYRELMRLNDSFGGKYKEMVLNLCFMNVREALAIYTKIFANRFWVQGNRLKESSFTIDSQEYSFNNINVIRAIGCGNSAVFTGMDNSVIPNMFLSTESEDLSIQCLIVMRYFIIYAQRIGGTKEIAYGENTLKLGKVRQQWLNAVGEERTQLLYRALVYLFDKKILRKSIEDTDDIETIDTEASLKQDSKLYISPLGYELMEMLGRDSVLLEMLRECAWREYDGRNDSYSRDTSFELLLKKEQHKIFIDLLEYIDYLREEEEKMFFEPDGNVNLLAYRTIFGSSMLAMQLLDGVEKSLNYSGIMAMPDVSKKFRRIRNHIDESCRRLQE